MTTGLWGHSKSNNEPHFHKLKLKHFGDHPEAIDFMDRISTKYEFSKDELLGLLQTVTYNEDSEKVLKSVKRPPEKATHWKYYRKQFLSPERIQAGKEFWRKHNQLLNKISYLYRIPSSIIVATIGVESFYGKYTGKFQVLNSLITLSFKKNRRNKFYRSELEQFFLLAKNNEWPLSFLTNIKGSYSGAIGPAQFIPSSINYLSVDWNKDGKKDMLGDIEDVIASVGYYYHKAKWQPGKKIVGRMKKTPIMEDKRKDILKVVGDNGVEYWKMYPNFKTILRYNNSKLYVLALFQLSKEIFELKKVDH